jgi:P-type Ca2+ transporter type 2C
MSLSLDPIDPSAMRRPPRILKEPLLNKKFATYLFSLSLLITIGTLIICYLGLKTSKELAHSLTFTTLIVLELLKVQLVRLPFHMTLLSNRFLLLALASSFLLQLMVLYVPSLHLPFGTKALSLSDWGFIAAVSTAFYALGRLLAKLFYKV